MEVDHSFTVEQNGELVVAMTKVNLSEELKGLCEEVVGNGLAEVDRSRSSGFSIKFGAIRINSHCRVKLTCNQDVETIEKAASIASYIVDKVVFQDDAQIMEDYLKHCDSGGYS